MIVEQFNRGTVEGAHADLNTKLFEGGYPGAPGERGGDKAKGARDNQFGDSDYQLVRQKKDSTDTRQQQLDDQIKKHFGAEVFDHLKDRKWLADNIDKLKDGFKNAKDQDAWEMAWRMRELSKVDGTPSIYLSKQDGPTRGNLIPKRYDIYLRRPVLSDYNIGQLYH